ncbi:MAG: LysM peptidoglycan-binding domain-containing protein [Verrucomicrobiota bacterium]
MKKTRDKSLKGKMGDPTRRSVRPARACLPLIHLDAKMGRMKPLTISVLSLLMAVMLCPAAFAQTPPPSASEAGENKMLLEALTKKVDEQSAKIDALSQQILKLEQRMSAARPGVMIGEATPPPAAAASNPETPKPTQAGNSHLVAKGETLTSIAKMHKVSVEELQKFNHIENDRKLQIGQTIMIPAAAAVSPAPSPNE